MLEGRPPAEPKTGVGVGVTTTLDGCESPKPAGTGITWTVLTTTSWTLEDGVTEFGVGIGSGLRLAASDGATTAAGLLEDSPEPDRLLRKFSRFSDSRDVELGVSGILGSSAGVCAAGVVLFVTIWRLTCRGK